MASPAEIEAIKAEAAKTRDNCDYCKSSAKREQAAADRTAEQRSK